MRNLYVPPAEIGFRYPFGGLLCSVCDIVSSAVDSLGYYGLHVPHASYLTVDLPYGICIPGHLDGIRPIVTRRYGIKGGPSPPDPDLPVPLALEYP